MDAAAMNVVDEIELATWKLLCMRFRLLKRLVRYRNAQSLGRWRLPR